MSEEQVIRHCAPTLASIKTGNLFSCPFASREALMDNIRNWNRRLADRGLRVILLRYQDGVGLIYVYRPSKLGADLRDEMACSLLRDCGYACENPNRCIKRLMDRLKAEKEFPHEIGLFLGYPPEDVQGFMYRRGEAKYSGLWKVYGDVTAAEKRFAHYKKCTDIYLKKWAEGSSIERLTVTA